MYKRPDLKYKQKLIVADYDNSLLYNDSIVAAVTERVKDKDAIVNNVNKSSNKQQTIREMCDVYPQLEKDILPQIRRAEVYTTETVEEQVMKLVERK